MALSVKTITTLEGLFKQAGRAEQAVASEVKVVEQASSIFKQTSVNTNPLTMDAKATLAKLKIGGKFEAKKIDFNAMTKKLESLGIKPRSEYEEFEGKVLEEARSSIKVKQRDILHRINPITPNNIGAIKSEILPLIENPELKQQIANCANPDELYKMLKENIDDILRSDEHVSFMKKVEPSAITPELEHEYSQLATKTVARINKIMHLFTSKSINPEVLSIEAEVRALGVSNVHFSDDLEQAKLIRDSVKDLIDRQIPLPDSITITPMMTFGKGGCAAHIKDDSHIFLPTSLEDRLAKEANSTIDVLARDTNTFRQASSEHQEKFLSEIAIKKGTFHSTQNPKHAVIHEVAHTFQPTSLEARVRMLAENELKTAGEISIYAKSSPNGFEAMPEMFAKLMDGQTLTDKQMELYLKLGGIIPKF